MFGNCATGMTESAIKPASTMTIDTTIANFGRAMKKSESIASLARLAALRHRPHHLPGPYFLHAFDDDLVALLQPGSDDPFLPRLAVGLDAALHDAVVAIDNQHVFSL